MKTDIEKVTLEFMQVGEVRRIANNILAEAAINSEFILTREMECLCLGIKTWLLKSPHPAQKVTLYAPADWWEHFKERWFPDWAKQRWPVRYGIPTEYEYGPIYVCPHSTEKWDRQRWMHIQWLASNLKAGVGNE